MDYGFLGERESQKQVTLFALIRERRQNDEDNAGSGKGIEFPSIAKRAAKFVEPGLNRVTLRCDNEPAIVALAREIAQTRQARH